MHPIDAAVARNILPIACIIGATVVAASGHEGWGWLIFAAILLS